MSGCKLFKQVWIGPLLWMIIFGILIIVRSPGLFLYPRFWAEEATDFYPPIHAESIIEAITFVYRGSYQFLANMMVFLATRVPLLEAPKVTTYLSYFVGLVVAYQLGVFIREYKISIFSGLTLVIAFLLQWGMYEVSLSATNIQWVAGLSMLLVLAIPCTWLDNHLKITLPWLFICGISGVPAAIVAPAFALKALLFRSRNTAIASAILFSTAVIQIVCIFWFGVSDRNF